MTDRSAAAIEYLKQGFSVIPVLPGDKRPACEWKEFQERYAADEEVVEWWKKWPDANVGVITGIISGISVIDVDGKIGLASIGNQPVKPPSTRVIKTPHGWHLYYKYRDDWHTGAGFLPGIDVRNDGGYVVAPPSQIEGVEYKVFRANEIAEITLPLAALQAHSRNGTAPSATEPEQGRPTWVRDAISKGAAQHVRNDTATRLIGYFHSLGTPRDVIEVILSGFASKCDPPMDARELEATIESVTRYQTKVRAARVAEPPEFRDEGDSLVYSWAQHAVSIRLSNLDSDKEGVHSQIVIEAGPPGIPPIIYGPANFNLVSTPARNSLVQYMGKRYELDWAGILESVARLAVLELREGEPVVDLRDYQKSETKWLLPPFVLDDQATFLFADGGSGKSLFALALLLTIQLDTPALIGKLPSYPVKGLYLDWESTAQEHAERYQLLLRGAGIDPTTVSVLYRRCDTPLVDQVGQLQRVITTENIGFVVIDSVVAACSGEAEQSDTARQFFAALRKLRVPSVCVSHTTKQNDTSHKPFGCYSEDTEVMTRGGWKAHSAVTLEDEVACFNLDTNLLEWGQPSHLWSYDYDGSMVRIHGGTKSSLDMLVTPNHRMVVKAGYPLPIGAQATQQEPTYLALQRGQRPERQ